jgi:Pup amidohydrolase
MSFNLWLGPEAPFDGMKRVFGIETEYGITVNGVDTVDVVAESIELVRCYTEHGALMKWDYELEDPHLDARGFRADSLMQDTDESAYYELDKNRPLSFEEIKSDLVLSNGARFYNDHAHPEYSTPECTTLREIIAQDKAGERILSECVRRRNKKIGPDREVRLYKNNTDFVGHSYGCHDNYLMSRAVPWDRLVNEVIPFLVTRQIFAGAGKMGIEGEGSAGQPGIFQISQRSDFFSVLVSIDTMNRRPIVNTRDEPHADPGKYRRFHVILGDSNMNECASALKIGTMALVLELIEKREAPQLEVAQAIDATKSISRDQTYDWIIELKDGRKISAVDVQRMYLQKAKQFCDVADPEVYWLLKEWENVLNDLDVDYRRCVDRVDWVAKKYLLNTFQEEEGLNWNDPWLQSIDLEYHNIAWEQGLYYELLREDRARRFLTEDDIKNAVFAPPDTTRAYFRGRAVARFNAQIQTIHWDEIVFGQDSNQRRVSFNHATDDERIERLNAIIRQAADYGDFLHRLEKQDL